jgi:Putative Flp pilus-assembly TadE/G-like
MIPMIVLCFLLAGLFVTTSIAVSGAFLAQRDLAGVCDGAAIAAANAFAGHDASPAAGGDASPAAGGDASPAAGGDASPAAGGDASPAARGEPDSLPLSDESVAAAVARYRAHRLSDADRTLAMSASTDGRVVTVTCRRTVRIPFGAVLGYGDGLERTAVARARSPLD